MDKMLITVNSVTKEYGALKALDDVSLNIYEGESLGLVGESGSGKSTLARIILRLIGATNGEIKYNGIENIRKDCQIVFQDPQTSLNPKIKIGDAIAEPLLLHKIVENRKSIVVSRVKELLNMVQLPSGYLNRYPHELSGGERQRVGIARALASRPKFIVLDEPVSSLDLSIQEQVLDLLKNLKQELDLTYLFIAHDLAVIKYLCDRVAVMHYGQIVEIGSVENVYNKPKNPYTQILLKSSY